MADDQDYSTEASGEDEASRLLKKILSPAEAQSLVLPPPNHAPASGPGESTPLTGNLAKPPSQATPSRAPADGDNAPVRRGLAGYFAASAVDPTLRKSAKDPDFLYLAPQAATGAAFVKESRRKIVHTSNTIGNPGYGAPGQSVDRSGDPQYVKISSRGQVGYLPKANLPAARQIDQNLKVLDEA
jgi:hypothetical protein